MRKRVFRILIPALLAVLTSCEREKLEPEPALSSGMPIAFGVVTPADVTVDGRPGYQSFDGDGGAATRASVVSSLSSFRVSAVTGSSGSESAVFTNQTFTGSAGTYTGGRYWPVSDPGYKFFASNVALTYTSSGATVSASNSTDVICAYMPNPTFGEKNTLVFNHIFSRIGNVTVAAESGFTVSGVSVTITPYVSGTYNLETGAWSGKSAGSATSLANSSPGTKSNDLWLVPGSYTVTCSWSAAPSGGGSAMAYTNEVSESFTLIAGKTSAMTITMGASVVVEVLDLTHSDAISWDPPMPSFGGLNIAPAPLYYDGSSFIIKDDDWNHSSFGSVRGKNNGSYYFSFIELGSYFDGAGSGFSTSSGSIDNANKLSYDGYDNWRLPTQAEWNNVVPGSSRAGSTINGVSGRKYAIVRLTGVTHAGSSTPLGIIIAPDGKTFTCAKSLNWNTSSSSGNEGVTVTQLDSYLDNGCAFIPASGFYEAWSVSSGDWLSGGDILNFHLATESNSSNDYRFSVASSWVTTTATISKSDYYFPVWLVKEKE